MMKILNILGFLGLFIGVVGTLLRARVYCAECLGLEARLLTATAIFYLSTELRMSGWPKA